MLYPLLPFAVKTCTRYGCPVKKLTFKMPFTLGLYVKPNLPLSWSAANFDLYGLTADDKNLHLSPNDKFASFTTTGVINLYV